MTPIRDRFARLDDPARLQQVPPPPWLRILPDGLLLAVKVLPRATADELVGPLGAELRVKVTAPPVDSAANEALLSFLAGRLDCPRNRLELVRGHASRHKVIRVHGLPAGTVIKALASTKS